MGQLVGEGLGFFFCSQFFGDRPLCQILPPPLQRHPSHLIPLLKLLFCLDMAGLQPIPNSLNILEGFV